MEKILTIPTANDCYTTNYCTGNHYVSLPQIDTDGNILSVNSLSMSYNSLLELSGQPLIAPYVLVNGKALKLNNCAHRYSDYFIPTYGYSTNEVDVKLEVVAPQTIKGFVYAITLTAKQDMQVACGVTLALSNLDRTIFHKYRVDGKISTFIYEWTNCVIAQVENGASIMSLALSGNGDYKLNVAKVATCGHESSMSKGQTQTFYYYFSVGCETDGAALNNMDMKRRGGQQLIKAQRELLISRAKKCDDKHIEQLMNVNFNFCYYFACGYTLDTDDLVLVTSKSPRYYVSAAYWSRDTLLWAFPAIVNYDVAFAKKLLLTVFTRYIKNCSIHALYLSGTVLYPGFELDELVAPIIALKRYVDTTNDSSILDDDSVKKGIEDILTTLAKWQDKDTGLYATELDSSDDPHENRYVTYDNCLVQMALSAVGQDDLAKQLRCAIEDNCVKDTQYGKMYVYSIDGERSCIYDNPPGSLILLAYYGYCKNTDEAYVNTLKYTYSKDNIYYYCSGDLFGCGCEHVKYPWIKSICNYMLSNGVNDKVLAVLDNVTLDNYVACESFNIDDGKAKTGEAFATFAGFLAYSLFATFCR